jgi:hypothetical protein
MPRTMARIHANGGQNAVDMVRFLRAAEIWGILMVGSALTLAAACIQLAIA